MPTQEYKVFYNEDTKKWELLKPYKTIEIDCMTEEDYLKALEWLKKDEPQKPIPAAKTKIDFVPVYKCPHCGKEFSGTGVADYCYKCGQHFDWSDNNERSKK